MRTLFLVTLFLFNDAGFSQEASVHVGKRIAEVHSLVFAPLSYPTSYFLPRLGLGSLPEGSILQSGFVRSNPYWIAGEMAWVTQSFFTGVGNPAIGLWGLTWYPEAQFHRYCVDPENKDRPICRSRLRTNLQHQYDWNHTRALQKRRDSIQRRFSLEEAKEWVCAPNWESLQKQKKELLQKSLMFWAHKAKQPILLFQEKQEQVCIQWINPPLDMVSERPQHFCKQNVIQQIEQAADQEWPSESRSEIYSDFSVLFDPGRFLKVTPFSSPMTDPNQGIVMVIPKKTERILSAKESWVLKLPKISYEECVKNEHLIQKEIREVSLGKAALGDETKSLVTQARKAAKILSRKTNRTWAVHVVQDREQIQALSAKVSDVIMMGHVDSDGLLLDSHGKRIRNLGIHPKRLALYGCYSDLLKQKYSDQADEVVTPKFFGPLESFTETPHRAFVEFAVKAYQSSIR